MSKDDWWKAEANEWSKRKRADEKRLLSSGGTCTVGVPDVTEKLKLKNFPEDVSGRTVRRAFVDGSLPSEYRVDVNEPYCINVNSYPPIDPRVDLRGVEQIAQAAGISERQTRRLIEQGTLPADKLFGRYYSCQSSVDAWKKK